MRQLLVLAAIAALAVAKPETYREKEDFQYSRSSSDEGTKAGFYGAQRGNMGGNYERAHNMDSLAQNQMSGLVRTVEGELGDGAKQHTGNVYTAAKSTGVYGSGLYDLSNLEGRNFQEGTSNGDSQSLISSASQHSTALRNQHSASNTAGYSNAQILNAGFDNTRAHDGGYASTLSQNAGYNTYGNSHSHGSGYGRYNTAANADQALYSNSHQGSNLDSESQYEDRNIASQNSRHYSQTADYQGHVFDQGSSLSHGSNIHSRLYSSGSPVKIVIRPGTRVTVPVAAQTYDASQSSSSIDHNAIHSDTEVLNSNKHEIVSKPKVKNYESSYSYNKEWEKHDTKPISGIGVMPLAIPTVNPYPANSELYEDAQALILEQQQRKSGMSSQSHHSSHSGYNSASSNQYNTQQHTGLNSGIKTYHGASNGVSIGAHTGASSAYNQGQLGSYIGATNGASNLNLVDDANTKPKSYQSSYSYHKSWERQGDPYVILPTTNGDFEQMTGKLTAGSLNQGAYGSHQYGSHSHQHSHQGYNSHSGDDCDEHGHIRKVRSPNWDEEVLGKQAQNSWEQFRQQGQKQSEELGQKSHDAWDLFDQQTKKHKEELEQQIHNTWQQFGQESQKQNDKLEDFGHQTQNTWDLLGQQTQKQGEGLGRLGQETRNKWDKLRDEGQQTLSQWGRQLDAIGQETHNQWSQFGQQIREARSSNWDKIEDFQKHTNQFEDFGQETQHIGEVFSQQTDTNWHTLQNEGQQVQEQWDQDFEDLGQQTNSHSELFGQQKQKTWDNLEIEPQSPNDMGQQTQDTWTGYNNNRQTEQKPNALDASNRHFRGMNFDTQSRDDKLEILNSNNDEKHVTYSHTLGKNNTNKTHIHTIWDEIKKEEIGQENEDTVEDLSQTADLGQQTQITWDNMNHKENSPWYHNTVETAYKAHHDLTNSEIVTPNPHPWMYNQVYSHHTHNNDSTSSNQYLAHHSSSSYSASQSHSLEGHSTNTNTYSNGQMHSTGSTFGSSITSLWDKLGNSENQTIPLHESDKHKNIADIFGAQTQQNENTNIGNASHNQTNQIYNIFGIQSRPVQNNAVLIKSTTIVPNTDIGRGDIGPENSKEHSKPDQSKFYKSLEEIDSLSLIKETNISSKTNVEQSNNSEDERDLRVMSLDQQQSAIRQRDSKVKITSTTQRNNNINHKPLNVGEYHRQELPFENQNQTNFDRHAFSNQFEFEQETDQKQNADQQVVDFGQQSENFEFNQMESQSSGQSESFRHEKAKDLRQQNEQFVQVSLSGWKPDEIFSQNEHKGNDYLEQQRQTGWTESMESQQVQVAWKPTEDVQQQSQLTEPFSQPMEDLSQQVQSIGYGVTFHQGNDKHETLNLGQQNEQFDQVSLSGFKPDAIQKEHQVNGGSGSEELGQQSQSRWTEIIEDQQVQTAWKPEDLQQQSQLTHQLTDSMENLNQQVQNAWKPEDLQPQSQLTHELTDSMENLNQQVQTAWKPEDLQQQSQFTHQLTDSMENLNQQVQSVWKPEDLLQQNHQLTDSMENLNQQVQTAWKPTEDLQQQSKLTDTFSQREQNITPSSNQKTEVSEELIVPKKVATVDSLPEVEVTEKPGFWKSVGNKFSSAKDKVSSWFSRSSSS